MYVLPISLRLYLQYGFISYHNEGGPGSVFFHMNSLTGGCDPGDLRPGDEVEFLISVSHKTQKTSAIHVKKLRCAPIRIRTFWLFW